MAEAAPVAAPSTPITPPGEGAAPPTAVAESNTPAAVGEVTPPADAPKTELGAAPKTDIPSVTFDAAKLKLPEGMKADDPAFKNFSEVFTDDKLSVQDRGQKLIDLYHENVKAMTTASRQAWTDTNTKWVNEVKADAEIGGAKFETTKTTIARAIDSLGPDLSVAFRQGLDATGAGNHPAIWKGLAKMASLLTEGGHVQGAPPSGKPDLGATFFPNSKMT
jgi:hypothetical protein